MTTKVKSVKRSRARAGPPVSPLERVEELSGILNGLDTIRDEERKRLSRDLHDTLISTLSATKLECDWMLRAANADTEESKRRLTRVSKSLTDAILFTRRVIDQLWPTIVQHLGLVSAIDHQLSELRKHSGAEVQVDAEGEMDTLPEAHALTLYRTVLNAMERSSRQQPPSQLQVTLRRSSAGVELRIAQEGLVAPDEPAAMQLERQLIRERVLRLGGDLLARESRGTRHLRLFLPVPPLPSLPA